MNPLKVANTLTSNVVHRINKRKSISAIKASPQVFTHLPAGTDRYQAALYFADPMVNAYQIRQWYEPLRRLSEFAPVVILVRNPETAIALLGESPLPIYYAPTIADIEEMLETQDIRAVFYVNQNIRNFQMMRFNDPAHVFISHGESEKAYMWSNQLKAYDYVFSAGQAARDRLAKNLLRYDAIERTRLIGRPQIDVEYPAPVVLNADYKTVLYAPTWEGDRPSMSYGSVTSHGTSMIKALVESGKYNVIFRPHPRSGINSHAYKAGLESIRVSFILNRKTGAPSYVYDESDSWGWQWACADICVTDISAVAYDWLATGKPIIVTTPKNENAAVSDSPALLKLPALSSQEASNAVALITELVAREDHDFIELVEHYFGETASGASMQRFITESLSVMGKQPSLDTDRVDA
ncbi:CDP-glycerol glycerophosphotransferase family protein [Paeniglutamicibacter psychrophenolicus]|uniref:CDP-glycerol--glycerophosphate glycerophosphotransferase n=1 Tax=Paeniglutamicibacter psychrophenolicus TaxID=257454 RepID=A0ABS4WE93_9MICC|nr:CDP-glycerol glycerophosphotransferase family protein [Paeniglutamicibacter psychrophenolicus]MBP2374485.1 hypothetical protein [Paeniglutamicibacter psychrophenolicus]